jgi:hypothetical protein
MGSIPSQLKTDNRQLTTDHFHLKTDIGQPTLQNRQPTIENRPSVCFIARLSVVGFKFDIVPRLAGGAVYGIAATRFQAEKARDSVQP